MRRIAELDAVRGLASLMILVYHFYARKLPFGWAAVDLFFVLSGFLITSIILANQGGPSFLRTFYIRRGLRIWPIYYLGLLVLLVLGPSLPRPSRIEGLPYYLTYTQYLPLYWSDSAPEFSWYYKHTWTLAIEEQFYLLWPALVLLVGRRRIVPLALGLLACSVSARAAGFHHWILFGRADGLALGGLLAAMLAHRAIPSPIPHPPSSIPHLLWGRISTPGVASTGARPTEPVTGISEEWDRERRLRRGFVALAALALVYLAAVSSQGALPDHGPPKWPAITILAINTVAFAVVGLVVVHAGRPALWFLRGPILGYLGRISYGLYLYHMIVLRIRMDYAEKFGWRKNTLVDLATIAGCFALAALSWRFIEQPILALKDRYNYRPAPTPSAIPAPAFRRSAAARRRSATPE